MTRKKIAIETEAEVLVCSRRRCCICFGMSRDIAAKRGQIAHLDRDNSNNAPDNLAFLCLEHHDVYDSPTSQSKNFTLSEVKKYRDELYQSVIPVVEEHRKAPDFPPPAASYRERSEFDQQKANEQKKVIVELLENGSPIRSISFLAHRLSLGVASVERLLYELAKAGILRVDREKRTTRKTFSLATSPENQLIDTFVAALGSDVVSDNRYIGHREYELDALVTTASGITYAVETTIARKRISGNDIELRIHRLNDSKRALRMEDARSVLIIGITQETVRDDVDLRSIEDRDVLVKYVELA